MTARALGPEGVAVTVRALTEADGPLVRALFDALSQRSRYNRFHGVRDVLRDADIAYLTHTDERTHVAWIATVHDEEREVPVGITRFVRDAEHPNVAEPALAVVDAYQHCGIGTLLLEHLMRSAADCGITILRAHVLASNEPMRSLLRKSRRVLRAAYDGEDVDYEVAVPA